MMSTLRIALKYRVALGGLRRAGSGGGEGRSALQAAQWSILSVG